MLKAGEKAPDVNFLDMSGRSISLSSLVNDGPLVLFFYPRDFSPGCTKQACMFRDVYEDFIKAGANLVGISTDGVDSHNLFKEKHELPYSIFSDPQGLASKAFAIPKSFGVLPGRATFVLDKKGICHLAFSSQLNIQKHIDEAIKTIKEMGN